MKVVEIVVDDSCIGAFLFGDMGQETAASEQIDEHSRIGEVGKGFSKFVEESTFLSHEREGCRVVDFDEHNC